MKVQQSSYPGWNQFPVYQCNKTDDWHEVSSWLHKNECDPFLLSSGSTGYVFQVRKNIEWFMLKWV
jgi:hypothetical protein